MKYCTRLLLITLAMLTVIAAGCGKERAKAPQKKTTASHSQNKSKAKAAAQPDNKQQSQTAQAPAMGLSGIGQPGALDQILQSGAGGAQAPGAQSPMVPSLRPSAPGAKPVKLSNARPTPQQLLAAVQSIYRSAKSLKIQGKATTVLRIDGKVAKRESVPASTTMLKKPDKFLISEKDGKICGDGKNVYKYSSKAKRFTKTKMSKEIMSQLVMSRPGVNSMGLFYGVNYAPAVSSMSLLKDAKVGGVDTFVLRISIKQGVGAPKGVDVVQTLWIAKKNLAVYKNELDITMKAKPGAKGPKVMHTTMTGTLISFAPNANIPDSQFQPPSGAKPVEKPKLTNLNDKDAPDFSFKWTDGSEKKLSDFRGKVVVLDFWALPMSAEHLPILQRIYEKYPDITIVSINFNSDTAKLKEYIEKKKYTFPMVQANEQIAGVAQKKYGVLVFPTMYMIDSQGVVKRTLLGNQKIEDIDAKLAKVK